MEITFHSSVFQRKETKGERRKNERRIGWMVRESMTKNDKGKKTFDHECVFLFFCFSCVKTRGLLKVFV